MSKGLFVTGTGTDVGKTYVTALLVKKLHDAGYNIGYYKAAISGAENVTESDAGYVRKIAGLTQTDEEMLSYLYKTAVSPHLASQLEGNPVEKDVVVNGFNRVAATHELVTMEGSGGIMCPIRYDDKAQYFLEDIIQWLQLPTIIIGHAGLGTINSVVLTVEYLRHRHIPVKGIILNNYVGGTMEDDNITMIEAITKVPVLGVVREGDTELAIEPSVLARLYDELKA